MSFTFYLVLTAPVDIYARWIDELEKVNSSPYGDDEEGDEVERDSEHESDGYSIVCSQTTSTLILSL